MTNVEAVKAHYAKPGLLDRIRNGLDKTGIDPREVTIDQLGPVDEFHIGGSEATKALITKLNVSAGAHVLDAGSGLGGPARRLAAATGCRVTGVDLSGEYCLVAEELSAWTGLAERTRFVQGDVTDLRQFEDGVFDAAWTIHVGMNVADKERFYGEVARVLKPGAAFVIFDVLRGRGGEIHYPVPFAEDASASALATLDEMNSLLDAADFAVHAVEDHTAAGVEFIQSGLARTMKADKPAPLGLHLVLGPKTPLMIAGALNNFTEGRASLHVIECRRAQRARS